MTSPTRLTRSIDVSGVAGDSEILAVAADICLPDPARLGARPTVLFCLPGGGVTKRFYDLDGEGDRSFSFAEAMAGQGFITVAIDHLGVGESSRPRDGFAVAIDQTVQANALAVDDIIAALRVGTLAPGFPSLPTLRSIGVGHSMGGLFTVLQQAHHRQHDAVIVLGFSTNGLPIALTPEELAFAGDPAGARANLARLTQAKFGAPYFDLDVPADDEIYGGPKGDARAMAAARSAKGALHAMGGLLSMIPGSVAPEAAAIDVPVFLGLGDRDIAGTPHEIPKSFTGSRDITLFVMPETRHCHFYFPTRASLFRRIWTWIAGLV